MARFRFFWLVFLPALLLTRASALTPDTWTPGPGWTLSWADEFDGTAVNAGNWTFEQGGGGWGNHELEVYATANAAVQSGELVITAARNADGSYSSARLKTQGKQAWKYGKVAARMRLPKGQGMWPAFWMLGSNISTVGWPKCGEIDIMEMIGGGENRDDSIYGTLHWDANGHAQTGTGRYELPDPQVFNDDYHVFEVEWSSTNMIWRLDGIEYGRSSVDVTQWPTMTAFHSDFFIILNLAVGGDWPGNPDTTTVFPQTLSVDWVRVYTAAPATVPAAHVVKNATVTVGHDVSFSAGDTAGMIQWQVSTDGSTWMNLANTSTYSGVNTATLTVNAATAGLNNLRYRFNATDQGVVATSNAATLTVAQAFFPFPSSIALDGAGNLYVSDASANTVQKIDTLGQVSLLAGTSGTAGSADGTGAAARFNQPGGIVLLASGALIVADTANATIRQVTAEGAVTTLAGAAGTRGGVDGTGTAANFSSPVGVERDAQGNIYVADAMNNTVRRITPAGAVTTVAGSAGATGAADGTGSSARFNFPTGIAVDGGGNLYVSDTTNNTLRKITPGGAVTTLAGLPGVSGMDDGTGAAAFFNRPAGLAVDAAGNLYVADAGNSTIRKVTAGGVVTTLAGTPGVGGLEDGTGIQTLFNQPKDLALNSAGDLYVADTGNATIRKITSAGVVTTLALSAAPVSPPVTPPPTPSPPTPAPSHGGGGGAPSIWFTGGLAALAALRHVIRPRPGC